MGGEQGDGGPTGESDPLLRAIAAASDRPPEEAPARIAHFRILSWLGSGGMGVVYRAEDETLRRTVALKVLRAASDGEERRQRFLREARSAAAITHANVAVVHQVGEAEGRVYIAMELVEGESLRERLERGPFAVETALELAVQIARGLAAAHDKGIVHRDLKPENIMITPAGVVKLLDFGIAKSDDRRRSGETEGGTAKTETLVTSEAGRIMGTPQYMSPEQALGEPVDVRSDVFSFGVVLYEMLAGARPFQGATMHAVLMAMTRDPPPPLRERATQVDESTEAVVRVCLAKTPGDRFANAGAVVVALAGQRSPKATTQSRTDVQPVTRTEAPRRRSRALLVAAGLLAACVVGALGWWVIARRPAVPVATSASPPAPRAMTEWPAPRTSSPEAAAAYAAGLQAFRDGSVYEARRNFQRAVGLDPDFAAANLRLALLASPAERQHQYLAVALSSRASLDARDQLFAACLQRLYDSPTAADTTPAFDLANSLADDPEMQLIAAMLVSGLESVPLLDRALRLDPKLAVAEDARASVLFEANDFDGALAAADRCLTIAPGAASCLRRRAEVHSARGDCVALEGDARSMMTVEPLGFHGYGYLWEALAAQGAPVETLQPLARKMETLGLDADHARRLALLDAARLATYTGDFASAEASLLALGKDLALAQDENTRSAPPLDLLRLYIEVDDPRKAADLGADYLRKLPALGHHEIDITRTLSLAALRRAGRVSEAQVRSMREAWRAEWRASPPQPVDPREWTWFYAYGAETAADAREALAALPDYAPQPEYLNTPWTEGAVGRVYALAGDADAALPRLRREAAWCGRSPTDARVDIDIQLLQDRFLFGRMLEQKGDREGACAQYRFVLDRWGHARPRSVTGQKARTRSRGLGCPP